MAGLYAHAGAGVQFDIANLVDVFQLHCARFGMDAQPADAAVVEGEIGLAAAGTGASGGRQMARAGMGQLSNRWELTGY